jgi:hypothetical protein
MTSIVYIYFTMEAAGSFRTLVPDYTVQIPEENICHIRIICTENHSFYKLYKV